MLPSKHEGDKVNLEVDVLGKYVERSLATVLDRLDGLERWQEVHICRVGRIGIVVRARASVCVCRRRTHVFDVSYC